MSTKERLSASVDADLISAAQDAVARGQSESVSAWVNDALRLKADNDRRLAALDEFIAAHESEFGEISEREMHGLVRAARASAVVVRGRRPGDLGTGDAGTGGDSHAAS